MNRIVLNADLGRDVISRHIYGHFSEHLGRCIYEGYWVSEDSPIPNVRGIRTDVVEALRQLRIPNLRWPGGCFADEYHWRDGIGPRTGRPTMINTHWGGVTETNHFGTHEFLDLCGQLGCEPYICGNVGSGTVQEMSQWVEYVNSGGVGPMSDLRRAHGRDEPWGVTWWGVGNENWGCGGQMRPEYYADLYRRYACYCRDYGAGKLRRIACGPNGANYEWTDVLMKSVGRRMWGLALHYYCGSGRNSRSATEFDENDWFGQLERALRMDELIRNHSAIMDHHDPEGEVALVVDEWGAWHAVEEGTNPGFLYQQNTIRDALVAGVTLHIFHNHCRRVRMANIAQTVNVLQAMILTDGEKMLRTPTYHVFDMFQVHQDATLVPLDLQSETYEFGAESMPALSASASRDADGQVHLSLCNLDPNTPQHVACEIRGLAVSEATGRVLTADAMTAHNTFDAPDQVAPAPLAGLALADEDGAGTRTRTKKLSLDLPPMSVAVVAIS